MKKKFDYNYLLIVFISLLFLMGVMRNNSFFGSGVDWYNQHVSFPEYFRILFYSTHNFFPSFSFNIGAGENIYNFSYYGLFNPLLLFSYLLPFVRMVNYIEILNVLIYISIGVLTYKFLKNDFSSKIALLGSIFMLLTSPIIFHIHRHYMFISYFPFLIGSFLCINNYFKTKNIYPFIIINTLLIFTSYYYSVTSIFVEVIYFTYIYLKDNKFKFREYFNKGIFLALGVLISIMISSVLLLPTLYAIKSGRESELFKIGLGSLLLPNFNIKNFLYDYYGLGVSLISIGSILYFLKSKKIHEKFLGIVLSLLIFIPLFMYLLNGKLYIRAKVLIPFIPLVIICLCSFLSKIFNKNRISSLYILIPFILTFFYSIFTDDTNKLYIIFLIVDLIICYLFIKSCGKIKYLNMMIAFIFIVSIVNSYTENYLDYSYYDDINKDYGITKVLDNDKDIYRMKQLDNSLKNANKVYNDKYYTTSIYSSVENKYYKDFLINDLHIPRPNKNKLMFTTTSDIISDNYLGVKYVVNGGNSLGYQKYKKDVYLNNNTRSIIYSTSNVINMDDYEKIKYPYNLEYLFNGVILDDKTNCKIDSKIEKINLLDVLDNKSLKNISYKNNKYYVDIKKDKFFKVKKDSSLDNKLIFLNFDIDNRKYRCDKFDRSIFINGINNKISCNDENYNYGNNNTSFNYVFTSDNNLSVKISKGKYVIKNLNMYILNYNDFVGFNKNISNFHFNYKKTKGDYIVGKIDSLSDGYLVTSIPYDKGFSIYIDNKKVKVMKVNKAFIGSKIKNGSHNVKIIYKSPLLNISKVISFISLILLIIIIFFEKYVRCKRVTNKEIYY